jgi:beta-RFAP synthase
VRVTAPARLHLGFLDLNGGLGRRFGSIGLAIDQPATTIELSRAPAMAAFGPEADRALKALDRFAGVLGLGGAYRADVIEAIPAHTGLGSGTQLALSIGTGLAALEGIEEKSRNLGELISRGARSAIGMAAFDRGGFFVDGGRGATDKSPPVLMRARFPEAWRVILIVDPKATGVHGDRETSAFASLPEFPASAAGHLCRLVLMRLAPGLIESDITAFGTALTEIQEIVGGYFAGQQGGSAWSSTAVGRVAAKLAQGGAVGIGQSSWGPTGFGFVDSEDAARRLYPTLVQEAKAEGLEIMIVRGRNAGARIAAEAHADS